MEIVLRWKETYEAHAICTVSALQTRHQHTSSEKQNVAADAVNGRHTNALITTVGMEQIDTSEQTREGKLEQIEILW